MTFVDTKEKPFFAERGFTLDDEAVAIEESELALAEAFVARHRDDLRYVAPWNKWFIWRDGLWQEDDTLEAFSLARSIVAAASERLSENDKTIGQARRTAQAKTVWAVERLARAHRSIAAKVAQWDADPWLLNTPGGIVNLRTGELEAHDPFAYCSKMTAIAPADSVPADCLWLRFVHRVLGDDQELVAFVQRLLGYALTGLTIEEAFFFFHGTGANGKSKLLNTICGVVGGYHEIAPMETFVASKHDQHPANLAKLRGARIVVANETEQGRFWSESKIKSITGGDPISARFMQQNFFTYRPGFKLLVAGNHKPGLRNVDLAMRRRLHLIPFNITIPEAERDRNLEEKLRADWPIVLRWMIQGCLEWQRIGLSPPSAVANATAAYMAAEDTIQQWLDERCEVITSANSSFKALWTDWKTWAEGAGCFVGTQKAFAQKLLDRGFTSRRSNKGQMYLGLMVRGQS